MAGAEGSLGKHRVAIVKYSRGAHSAGASASKYSPHATMEKVSLL